MLKIICKYCKKEFQPTEKNRKYCSRSCSNKKHHTETTKRKMSKKYKGKGNPFYGKKHNQDTIQKFNQRKCSIETRRKMREAHLGSKSHLWKGGLSKIKREERYNIMQTLDYKLWREAVFARDRYTCQWCGDNKGKNLNAHHLLSFKKYPELIFVTKNGLTLCNLCHIEIHKKQRHLKLTEFPKSKINQI